MALKGIDIFKLSPKKNCKECGCPTCMAFCMKVAAGGADITKCPYMRDEVVAMLSEAAAPAMQTVEAAGYSFGGETVMYRHEKTFVSPNRYAVAISEDMTDSDVDAALAQVIAVDYERMGQRETVEFICVRGNRGERLAALCQKAAKCGRGVVIDTGDVNAAREAVNAIREEKPVLLGANGDNYAEMHAIASEAGIVLGVRGDDISALHETITALEKLGNRKLMADITGKNVKETFANAVQLRRSAILDGERSCGYPAVVDVQKLAGEDAQYAAALAALFTVKYGSLLIMPKMDYAQALALFGLRQNVFSDPQKPMKVAPGIYPINGAGPDDPCALTVDFALTYFLVAGELERSRVPINLLITDASGMSVLTAWAAGKLSAAGIRKFFDEFDMERKIRSRTLIIPGKVAVMREEIQEKLPEWNVVVGTGEAVELVSYLKDGKHEQAARAVAAQKAAVTAGAGEAKTAIVIPPVKHRDDLNAPYRRRDPDSAKFVVIGERIHCISPTIRQAMANFDADPILECAAQQIRAGATYLDVNIGPAETNGPELMSWAVKLLQENFDNVPLALDTANRKAIEAGIAVYDRTNGKPIINSADAGARISYIDLAADQDAICIALCSADGIAKDNEERMAHCHAMLERGLRLGMEANDLWFDPLFLVVKGMQDKQMEILNAIRLFSEEGLKSTGGLSNNSNGAPKEVRPILDAALMAMCMMQGLTSAIVNPNNRRMMETIRACDIFRNNELYSDAFLDF